VTYPEPGTTYPEPGGTYPEAPAEPEESSPAPMVEPGEGRLRPSPSFVRRCASLLGRCLIALLLGTFGVLVLVNMVSRVIHGQVQLGDWLLGMPVSLVIAAFALYGAFRMLRSRRADARSERSWRP
jgi:hypothetical protein